ncbi:MAG: emrA1 [Myxococcales bacterium]|nr:emrA1 [Myxococcales bacterium]
MTTTNDNQAPAPAKVVSPRKSKAMRAYLVLATLAAAVLGVYFIHGYLTRNEVSTDDAQVDADVVPVAARVSGVVLQLQVQDNQEVKAGQLLAVIDPADYDAKLAAANADLDAASAQAEAADAQVDIVKSTATGGLSSARAQLQGTSASVRAASSQVQAASAAVARARSELAKAEGDLTRAKTLHDQGAVTGQALESAQVTRDTAAAAVDQASANLAAARDQQQLSQTKVAEAQGRVEQSAPINQQNAAAVASSKLAHARVQGAKAAVDLAKLSLGYTKIIAPVDGYVSRLGVRTGQMVQPGTTVAMVVPRQTYVVANFKETQISRIRAGDDVEVKIDAAGTLRGKVASVAAGTGARFSMMPPDNATGNFVKVVQRVPVKIVWAAGQDSSMLQAGLSAEVTVHLSGK